jgi:hypothetical protein
LFVDNVNENAAVTGAPTGAPDAVVSDVAATQAPAPSGRDQVEQTLSQIVGRDGGDTGGRDERGRFAPKAPPADPATTADPSQPEAPAAGAARPADLPKAWGADKAQLWQGLPPEAQEYVAKRETEMAQFFDRHAGLKPFSEAAAANGRTLPDVLNQVVELETAFETDPAAGFILAAERLGLTRDQFISGIQQALARVGGQVEGAQVQPQTSAQPQYEDLSRRLERTEQMVREREMQSATAQVQQFFNDPKNEFAKEVQADIAAELRRMAAAGEPKDLSKAYERAIFHNPEARAKWLKKQMDARAATEQSRREQDATKFNSALTPTGGVPGGEPRKSKPQYLSGTEQVAANLAAAMGRG